ncbi:ABC-type branched-chain amino acid binding protein (modular protein) [Candidatus Terasakiella magnetica]|uniref:ABC-type branched-chain amino acid binding protein (Modular protein) n=1 Tax=Candidatus Terasakiella magnetica TaxID=1867952 RepID=A0A1C3RGV1_9PROT|nr:penicillin-binding protein activator [Candidatus Terasakiella magnetica]SCA56434.1 ABC-type branched-chain amino acid binding protein (modular protein) [Candidatus Terasakiella magnetica]
MFLNPRFYVLPLLFFITLVLSACQTITAPKWWEVPGTTPQARGPAPGSYDPTAAPRQGKEIVPWDPSQPTVAHADAQAQSQEWMTQYDVRGGVRAARVGLLVPLSGRAANVGKEIMNAAQLALFDFAGPNYELLPYDTQSTPEGAVQAVQYAIADGVSIVVGPLLSKSAQAIAPYLQASNVNALAFTNDSTAASQNVFVLGVRPEEEVERIINFAALQGSTRFALLAPADEYGIRVRTAFEAAVLANGAELSKVVQFLSGSDDLPAMIRDMADYDERRKELLEQKAELEGKEDALSQKALERLELLQTVGDVDFDALLVAAGGKTLQSIAANLPYYDVDPKKVRMLGTSLWEAKWVRAEPALLGGWFAAPSAKNRGEFVRQYRSVYDANPHRLATLAYDAVALSAVLANDKGEADYSRQTLTDPAGYLGRNGIFRLHQWGLAERGLAVMQVKQKNFREISPAPKSFAPVTN